MSKPQNHLKKTLAVVAKKLKWPENKSIGYETAERKDNFVNPLLTPPPPSCPKLPQDFRLFQRLGHWQPYGYDWNNQKADTYYRRETFVFSAFGGGFTLITLVVFIWFYVHRDSSSNSEASIDDVKPAFSETTINNVTYAQQKSLVDDLEMRLYNMLPLRVTSSLWGKINSYDLPIWMRSRLYDFFCRTYNCDMSEALESDYKNYKNLSEFFSRRLKPDSRPISIEPGVVSPADGLVLHFGPIMDGKIKGVKGRNYSVYQFLGLPSEDYEKELINDKDNNELYNCIIYLAPGDYHRFHSPADWLVNYRKHFPGRLLSVKPRFVQQMPEVLHINERVSYTGSWPHGFFSMTAVGATNVGSIKVNFDEVSKS